MKQFTKFVILNYLFWMALFLIHRIIFFTQITNRASDSSFSFIHALRLDSSMAAYLILIPCILYYLIQKDLHQSFLKALNVYGILALIFVSFVELASIPIFFEWENTIDSRAMNYLKNPSDVFMNISLFFDLGLSLLFILVFYFARRLLNSINGGILHTNKIKTVNIFHLFLTIAILFLVIRSGFQKIPIKITSAFYSSANSSNFIAVNKTFYFIKSNLKNASEKLLKNSALTNQHESFYKANFNNSLDSMATDILKTDKANIVFIILEGWPEEITRLKSNETEVSPGFKLLTQEAYLFSNFYSSGFRTDQGFLSILSAVPSFSNLNILTDISISQGFPSLYQDFKKMNYSTAFHYGGDLQFSNMKRYLLTQNVDNIVQQYDFDNSEQSMSWGVPDALLFEKSMEEISTYKEPFFVSILTSSSHNPFDIPGEYKFGDETNINKFKSSVYYTDNALKNFMDDAKDKKWYNNTLFIILSDHGTKYLETNKINEHGRYKIPFILYGNVLNDSLKNTVNTKIMNQYDIANSLLSLFNKQNPNYPFSQNIFSKNTESTAYWSRNSFAGFVTPDQKFVMNYKKKNLLSSYPELNQESNELKNGRLFMEMLSTYIKSKEISFK